VNLNPNPTAPLIPLYPNSPVGENRKRQNLTWAAAGGAAAGWACPPRCCRAPTSRPPRATATCRRRRGCAQHVGSKRVLTTQQGFEKGPYNSTGVRKGSYNSTGVRKGSLQLNWSSKRVLTTQQGFEKGSLQLNRGSKRVLTTQQGFEKGPYNSTGVRKGSLQFNRGSKRVPRPPASRHRDMPSAARLRTARFRLCRSTGFPLPV
jgi:hypothetical protein